MPDYRALFDSDWVKAWDLGGKHVTVQIVRVEAGTVENRAKRKKDRMPVLHFRGAKKPFGCNRTNGKTIAAMYGNNTDNWVGKSITIFPTKTQFGNDTVDCIRIRPDVPRARAVDMPNPDPPVNEQSTAGPVANDRCETGTCGTCSRCVNANAQESI